MAQTATQPFSPKTCSSKRPQISSCTARRGASQRRKTTAGQRTHARISQNVFELSSPRPTPRTLLMPQDITAITRVIWSPLSKLPRTMGSMEGCTAPATNRCRRESPPPCPSRNSTRRTPSRLRPGSNGISGRAGVRRMRRAIPTDPDEWCLESHRSPGHHHAAPEPDQTDESDPVGAG